jgi:hypothetical protein
VATCPGACRPSLGRRGDVDDGTVKYPRCCIGRAISCGQRTGVVPLFDRWWSRPGRDVAEGGRREMDKVEPQKSQGVMVGQC